MGYPAYVAKRIINAVGATTPGPGATYTGPTFIEAAGYRYWSVQVSGITTATVSFWGCIDELTYASIPPNLRAAGLVTNASAIWTPLPLSNSSEGGTSGGTATANGIYTWNMPLLDIAVNISAWTSGSISVYCMVVS